MEQRNLYIALNLIQGLAPAKVRSLLAEFGSPGAVLDAAANKLARVEGITPALATSITRWRETVNVDAELEKAEKAGARIVCLRDEDYPKRLGEIHDPPIALYVKGKLEPSDECAVAIVGSRQCSYYGRRTTEELARDLASRGLTIVSGLARGIDSSAHRGALSARGRTIAVLGCGIDVVYPKENAHLMEEVARAGAVISEFPVGTRPNRMNFPQRNRVISGLSLGVVVVEAAERSGALITARMALEQNREVFAVPGKIDSPTSAGTNRLIKDGAKLVGTVDDIIEELRPLVSELSLSLADSTANQEKGNLVPELSGEERGVYEMLSSDPLHIDEIIRGTGRTPAQIASALMTLEVKSLVEQLPGKLFVKR